MNEHPSADSIARYADIRGYTSQAATRLEVVAADDDPSITEALREQEFYSVYEGSGNVWTVSPDMAGSSPAA